MSKLTARLRELERWGAESPGHTWMLVGGVVGVMALVLIVAVTLAIIYLLPPGWTGL